MSSLSVMRGGLDGRGRGSRGRPARGERRDDAIGDRLRAGPGRRRPGRSWPAGRPAPRGGPRAARPRSAARAAAGPAGRRTTSASRSRKASRCGEIQSNGGTGNSRNGEIRLRLVGVEHRPDPFDERDVQRSRRRSSRPPASSRGGGPGSGARRSGGTRRWPAPGPGCRCRTPGDRQRRAVAAQSRTGSSASTRKTSCFDDGGGPGVDPLGPRASERLAGRRGRRLGFEREPVGLVGRLAFGLGGSSPAQSLARSRFRLIRSSSSGLASFGSAASIASQNSGSASKSRSDVDQPPAGPGLEPVDRAIRPSSRSGRPGVRGEPDDDVGPVGQGVGRPAGGPDLVAPLAEHLGERAGAVDARASRPAVSRVDARRRRSRPRSRRSTASAGSCSERPGRSSDHPPGDSPLERLGLRPDGGELLGRSGSDGRNRPPRTAGASAGPAPGTRRRPPSGATAGRSARGRAGPGRAATSVSNWWANRQTTAPARSPRSRRRIASAQGSDESNSRRIPAGKRLDPRRLALGPRRLRPRRPRRSARRSSRTRPAAPIRAARARAKTTRATRLPSHPNHRRALADEDDAEARDDLGLAGQGDRLRLILRRVVPGERPLAQRRADRLGRVGFGRRGPIAARRPRPGPGPGQDRDESEARDVHHRRASSMRLGRPPGAEARPPSLPGGSAGRCRSGTGRPRRRRWPARSAPGTASPRRAAAFGDVPGQLLGDHRLADLRTSRCRTPMAKR